MTKYICDKCGREQDKELHELQFTEARSGGEVLTIAELCGRCLCQVKRFCETQRKKSK